MILENLIEKKDIMAYVDFRIKHLILEREKVPYLKIQDKRKEITIKKLDGRIAELELIKKDINKLKDMSKYYYSKVIHLKKMKVYNQKN